MKFTLQLPTDRVATGAEFVSAEAIAEIAGAGEAAGFSACFVTDHPVPDDEWLASGGHHTLDPFVALSFAAAATTTLRLQTHVLVLPYRNPFLSAKAIASLDLLSGGRVIAGVAAGYLESEFAALGVDFDERNELCDEAIATMRRAWSEAGLELTGRHFRTTRNTQLPRPAQQPHPPIWVGGNSHRAIRRAVELGDGWLPFPAPAKAAPRIRTAALESDEELAARIAYAREHADAIGRTRPLDICFAILGMQMSARAILDFDVIVERCRSVAEMGVTWTTAGFPGRTRAEYCEQIAAFGERVIGPSS
ncbi:MAG: LLM class F420-dependent oxidoreductase [Deltaproteobacteria bacterium]|nr:LLM class F420-dependent oxidoreductase [Deltaproteobacteria bacterium]